MYSIGIFSRWNATCGISMHAELIGREFIKMGHNLKVFAPYVHSASRWWHHKIIRSKEESFVIRCYNELHPETMSSEKIDEKKVLKEDIDYLIVESYVSLPYSELEHLIAKIKKRVKVVVVIHEGKKEDVRYDLQIFDAVVVFDERYAKMHDWQARIIPYPCHPVRRSKKRFAKDKLVFFSFGRQPINNYKDYIEVLDGLTSKYDFVYKVIRSNFLLPFSLPWLKQEQKRLGQEEVYEHLHSSDIHLLPKGKTKNVVVSSTLFQCLGSLTPTIVPNTRHFEVLPAINGQKPAVIYRDVEDLREKIVMLVEDEDYRKKVIKAAERYVEENRSDRIARRFIDLYKKLS
jgi:glycosyltransferase involved in cell wall biosynthesis